MSCRVFVSDFVPSRSAGCADGHNAFVLRPLAVAIHLLMASGSLLAAGAVSEARAQAMVSPAKAAVPEARRYDIAAGALSDVLAKFSRVSGVYVVGATEEAKGKTSPGVHGTFAVSAALQALLQGTGLEAVAQADGTYSLHPVPTSSLNAVPAVEQAVLPAVTVIGTAARPSDSELPSPYAGGQVATGGRLGMLGNLDVMDTPFSVTSYTAQTIRDQQAGTVAEVLENDPAVRIAAAKGSGQDQYYIRGFRLGVNDYSLNGLYGIVPSYITSTSYVERVEVLKGPSALLNGMSPGGSVGGSINLVTKRATDEPITQFTTSYASRGQVGEHIDIGRRFGSDNEFGVRLNATYKSGNTSIDRNSDELGSVALGLDYRGRKVRLSGDFGYQTDDVDGATRQVYLPSTFVGVPAAPDAKANYQAPWGYQKTRDLFGMIQGEVDLTDSVTAYAAVGAHGNNFHYKNYIYDYVSNMSGDFTGKTYDDAFYYHNTAAQAGIRWNLDTGPLSHQLNFNFSAIESTYGIGYTTSSASYSGNIYTAPYGTEPGIAAPSVSKSSETSLTSYGIADTISALHERVQVIAGVRHQQIGIDSYNATGLQTSRYSTGVWSPAFTFLVKPLTQVSLYVNYIEGLTAGTVVGPTYANAGAVLPPYVSKQVETGIKVDWGKLITTISAFQISQPNAISITSADATLPTLAVDGKQRNRGVELETYGALTKGVRILGGITYLDARQTQTASHATDDKIAVGIPHVQLNLGAEWDTPFVPGLTLTGRVVYTGREYNDAANQQALPSWTRVDVGARYAFTSPWRRPASVNFNVYNLFDRSYWQQSFGGGLMLNTPRTFLLSATLNF